jgi:ATP-dependent helicase HepA
VDQTNIISKINKFMFHLNEKMVEWLSKRLPQITDDWWNELVINNLSDLQREQVFKNKAFCVVTLFSSQEHKI